MGSDSFGLRLCRELLIMVSKVKVTKSLKETIQKAVDAIGGFKKFINKGDTVLLKPNFNTSDPYPASSAPKFLKAVIELVNEQDPKKVILGGSCTFRLKTRKVIQQIDLYECENIDPPPEIVSFNEMKWVKKEIPSGKYLKSVSVPEILDQVDKLIFLPCLKTHGWAQFTGSLKLAVGFMKPVERLRLHMGHLQEKIAELNKVINPDVVIMDARKCFINEGPESGDLEEPNLVLASTSRVAIDIEGVKIIQGYEGNSLSNIKAEGLLQIKWARKIGIS